ncbi:MAG: competence/damage-inducible protein A [Planctomycetota bacterium]|jgi:nicotinamide-nucleotide amidase
MKKASIISVGNEILSGQTVDTNATYLSTKLLEIGIPVISSYTVVDETDRIVISLTQAVSDAEVVLVTGGLGPTDDDLTRQAFAHFLNAPLELQQHLLQKIQNFFAGRNLIMPGKNKIQAFIPAGTEALENNLGSASGIMTRTGGKILVAMPGVPCEMKRMFEESVLPELKEVAAGQAAAVRKIKCFGTGESNVAEILGALMKRGRNPLINCTAESGVITLHIIATAENKQKAIQMAQSDEKLMKKMLGNLVYGTGDESLAQVIGEKLAQKKKTIAIAESCTGGNLAKLITDVPGASRYFTHGWITYSNTAKIAELDVPPALIEKHGAVSEQVAAAMAKGARKIANTAYAIAITGIAGPTGATEQKPLGLVYISIDSAEKCLTKSFIFSHDRLFIRVRAAQTALNMLRTEFLI